MVDRSRKLWPIKAHYFFFFASVSPILPQTNVFGRQLGVPPEVMGFVTAVLPIFWALAKPGFGFLVDYFQSHRKIIFMGLVVLMNCSYCLLYFIPTSREQTHSAIVDITRGNVQLTDGMAWIDIKPLSSLCDGLCSEEVELADMSCGWACVDTIAVNETFSQLRPFRLYLRDNTSTTTLTPSYFGDLYFHNEYNTSTCQHFHMNDYPSEAWALNGSSLKCLFRDECATLSCALVGKVSLSESTIHHRDTSLDDFSYLCATFWGFVILICVGTVAYNVANSISDAICFDVLGSERIHKYGHQRAWGTVGYGLVALAAGWAVDWFSGDSSIKNFTPAFIITILFTLVDLYFCRKLELPNLPQPKGAMKTLRVLLSRPNVAVFLCFAVIVGMFDSFIIYYMFWFLEELAIQTDQMSNIKLLEGATIAAESFVGELLFFVIAGKIIKYFGFGVTLTFSLACYGVRLLLISLITNPWQILAIEVIMQGPTYALTYSTIVGYAAVVAPPGLSATLQGILAGMDDGFGFALGAFIGGVSYKYFGGRGAFQLFSLMAFVSALVHLILVLTFFKNYVHTQENENEQNEGPEGVDLLDKSLAGKIVSFAALERDEKMMKQDPDAVITEKGTT